MVKLFNPFIENVEDFLYCSFLFVGVASEEKACKSSFELLCFLRMLEGLLVMLFLVSFLAFAFHLLIKELRTKINNKLSHSSFILIQAYRNFYFKESINHKDLPSGIRPISTKIQVLLLCYIWKGSHRLYF